MLTWSLALRLVKWKRYFAMYWPHALIALTIIGAVWMFFAFSPEAN